MRNKEKRGARQSEKETRMPKRVKGSDSESESKKGTGERKQTNTKRGRQTGL